MKFKRNNKFTITGMNEYIFRQRVIKSNYCCPQCGFTSRSILDNKYCNSTTLCPECGVKLLYMGPNYRVPSKKRKKKACRPAATSSATRDQTLGYQVGWSASATTWDSIGKRP